MPHWATTNGLFWLFNCFLLIGIVNQLLINNYKKMYISTCLVFMISYVEGTGTLFNAVWYLVSPHTA